MPLETSNPALVRKTGDDVNLSDSELLRAFGWFNCLAGEDLVERLDGELAARFAHEIVARKIVVNDPYLAQVIQVAAAGR